MGVLQCSHFDSFSIVLLHASYHFHFISLRYSFFIYFHCMLPLFSSSSSLHFTFISFCTLLSFSEFISPPVMSFFLIIFEVFLTIPNRPKFALSEKKKKFPMGH